MKSIRRSLRNFFYAPAGSPRWRILLPYGVLGVLTLIVLVAAAYGWDYTNSPSFCGTACHTMPPEYTAYLTSPHARIDCVDCHIGKSFIATKITRKAGDMRHVIATVFKTYQYPIVATDLRPARARRAKSVTRRRSSPTTRLSRSGTMRRTRTTQPRRHT